VRFHCVAIAPLARGSICRGKYVRVRGVNTLSLVHCVFSNKHQTIMPWWSGTCAPRALRWISTSFNQVWPPTRHCTSGSEPGLKRRSTRPNPLDPGQRVRERVLPRAKVPMHFTGVGAWNVPAGGDFQKTDHGPHSSEVSDLCVPVAGWRRKGARSAPDCSWVAASCWRPSTPRSCSSERCRFCRHRNCPTENR